MIQQIAFSKPQKGGINTDYLVRFWTNFNRDLYQKLIQLKNEEIENIKPVDNGRPGLRDDKIKP
jgi:hypothetical protein